MKTITINILAEDIRKMNYTDPHECPITNALHMAGLNAHEGGGNIYSDKNDSDRTDRIITPDELEQKLFSMYSYINPKIYESDYPPTEPEDFSFELEVPDNW